MNPSDERKWLPEQNPDRPDGAPEFITLAGVGALPRDVIQARLREGWRCVRFEFCFSFLFATVRRRSPVYLTETWQWRYVYGTGYTLLAVLLGPWGIPWGPVWTAQAAWANLTGGVDVTDAVLAELERVAPPAARSDTGSYVAAPRP